MKLIGIDGCRAGWVCAIAEADHPELRFEIVTYLGPLFASASRGETLIAIDIPIGLADTTPRPVDVLARALLGPKQGSRVFPAPSRAALAGNSYVECCGLNERARGKRLSQQSYGILGKIRDVDSLMTPALQAHARETHPEVTFRIVTGAPLQHSKKTHEGQQERLTILSRHGIGFEPAAERQRLGRGLLQVDDLTDAAVCLVTARRIHARVCRVLGGELDAR